MDLLTAPINVVIHGEPISGSQLMFNRNTGTAYRPKKHKQRLFEVSEFAERACQKAGYEELPVFKQGTFVYLIARFFFPYRKADYRTGQFAGELKPDAPSWCIGNKDIDNLLKPLKDGVKGIIVTDDKQIVRYQEITKKYSETPRTEIEIGAI